MDHFLKCLMLTQIIPSPHTIPLLATDYVKILSKIWFKISTINGPILFEKCFTKNFPPIIICDRFCSGTYAHGTYTTHIYTYIPMATTLFQ